jgi:hypothetical protein
MSNLETTGGSGSGLTVNVTENGGYADTITIHTAGSGYTDGDTITVTSGSSSATFTILIESPEWLFSPEGELSFPDESVQTGAAISIAELKVLVAACSSFDDFKTAIAAL